MRNSARAPRRIALLLPALLLAGSARSAEAATWRMLTGRMAPDLVFAETANGIAPGSRLSSFRSEGVVLLVFWLRDCPHCHRELPKVQALHARNHRSGLNVISIVHKFPLEQVLPTMAQRGWTFPVVRDADGRLAAAFGGGRRPGYYLIGFDGRVKSSGSLDVKEVERQLGLWRLKELGAMPAAFSAARKFVYAGDYGNALRSAERVAAAPEATTELQAALTRLTEVSLQKLLNRRDRAEAWHRSGRAAAAKAEYEAMVKGFAGTSLEVRAKALRDDYRARTSPR